jgi:hypothetical protein
MGSSPRSNGRDDYNNTLEDMYAYLHPFQVTLCGATLRRVNSSICRRPAQGRLETGTNGSIGIYNATIPIGVRRDDWRNLDRRRCAERSALSSRRSGRYDGFGRDSGLSIRRAVQSQAQA